MGVVLAMNMDIEVGLGQDIDLDIETRHRTSALFVENINDYACTLHHVGGSIFIDM